MFTQRKFMFWLPAGKIIAAACLLIIVVAISSCVKDYPAQVGNIIPPTNTTTPTSTTSCSCTGGVSSTTPTSGTTTPASLTTVTVDTLDASPPHFSPNGGNFYFSTTVKLASDTLPPQAVYEFSLDNGTTWQIGQQFTLTTGGKILTRFRVGNKPSRSRAASFTLYYQRMMVVGNSIMSHAPAPEIGWTNFNGMAASAPEKDFVHLLTARLQTLNPDMTVRLQSGAGIELDFGKSTYTMDEFTEPLQTFKPDLIVVRLGENVVDGDVQTRNFEGQFRQFLERLKQLSRGYNQPVQIVISTCVWEHPATDAILKKVAAENGYPLVDLSCIIGQPQYFASQYANPGVAAHPNDTGMQKISDLIWVKIQ